MKNQNATFFKNLGLAILGGKEEFSVENSSSAKRAKLFAPFVAVAIPLFFLHSANPLLGAALLALAGAVLFFLCVFTTAADPLGKWVFCRIIKKIKDAVGGSFFGGTVVAKTFQLPNLFFANIVLPPPFSPPRSRFA